MPSGNDNAVPFFAIMQQTYLHKVIHLSHLQTQYSADEMERKKTKLIFDASKCSSSRQPLQSLLLKTINYSGAVHWTSRPAVASLTSINEPKVNIFRSHNLIYRSTQKPNSFAFSFRFLPLLLRRNASIFRYVRKLSILCSLNFVGLVCCGESHLAFERKRDYSSTSSRWWRPH